MANIAVSAFVIPASCIVILAGVPENEDICRFRWFTTVLCAHVSLLSFLFIALENYVRVCRPGRYDCLFNKTVTMLIVVLIWSVSVACIVLQITMKLGPQVCGKTINLTVNSTYYYIDVPLLSISILIALLAFLKSVCEFKVETPAISNMPPQQNAKVVAALSKEYSLLKTNFLVFVVFLCFWLPVGISLVVGCAKESMSLELLDNLTWLALSNTCVSSFIYGLVNKPFRLAFNSLFHYCCCKTSVLFTKRPRPEPPRPQSDVRVHIIPGYNMYAPPNRQQKDGRKSVSTAKRTAPKKAQKSRDVYEL